MRGEPAAGDDQVVVFDEYGPVRMIRDRAWKYIHRYPDGPHELYHLAEDPGEEHNLIGEPAYHAQGELMRQQLADWFQRYVEPELDGSTLPVTGSGQLGRAAPRVEGVNQFAGRPTLLSEGWETLPGIE